jgi:hypothetical protein
MKILRNLVILLFLLTGIANAQHADPNIVSSNNCQGLPNPVNKICWDTTLLAWYGFGPEGWFIAGGGGGSFSDPYTPPSGTFTVDGAQAINNPNANNNGTDLEIYYDPTFGGSTIGFDTDSTPQDHMWDLTVQPEGYGTSLLLGRLQGDAPLLSMFDDTVGYGLDGVTTLSSPLIVENYSGNNQDVDLEVHLDADNNTSVIGLDTDPANDILKAYLLGETTLYAGQQFQLKFGEDPAYVTGGFTTTSATDEVTPGLTQFSFFYGAYPFGSIDTLMPCGPSSDGANSLVLDAQSNDLGAVYVDDGLQEAEVTCFGSINKWVVTRTPPTIEGGPYFGTTITSTALIIDNPVAGNLGGDLEIGFDSVSEQSQINLDTAVPAGANPSETVPFFISATATGNGSGTEMAILPEQGLTAFAMYDQNDTITPNLILLQGPTQINTTTENNTVAGLDTCNSSFIGAMEHVIDNDAACALNATPVHSTCTVGSNCHTCQVQCAQNGSTIGWVIY